VSRDRDDLAFVLNLLGKRPAYCMFTAFKETAAAPSLGIVAMGASLERVVEGRRSEY
jgi:hypothetical protein